MNFDFSDEQKDIRASVRRLLADESSPERIRAVYRGETGYDSGLWATLGGMGFLGAAFPEAYGGSGAGHLELCVIAEELGRALAPVPFLSSVGQAAELLMRAGSEEQKSRYLSGIAAGRSVGAVALDPPLGLQLADGKLDGVATVVADAGIADFVIIACGDGEARRLGIVDLRGAGATVADRPSLDPCHRFGDIAFAGAVFEPLGNGPLGDVLAAVRDGAAVLAAFEQVGGASRALEMARDYALERKAFGRQIGSFQAIKHMLADMFVATELARSNAYYAAWALASGSDRLPLAAATARVSATRAYELCAANNIQTHGGIGFTAELDCHLYYRRSSGLAHVLGSVAHWEDRLVRELDRQREAI